MDPAALAARLEAIEERRAGSDAERRATLLCADELRASGREPRTTTLWFRPQIHGPRALWAALGVAASVVSVSHHVVGLALAGGALLAVLLDAAGIRVLAPVLARRATQNLLAPPPAPTSDDALLLILTASVDAPARSALARTARIRGATLIPGPAGLLVLSALAVAICAALRLAGASGAAVGVIQLIPSVVLIGLVGLFVEAALAATPSRSPAGGPAAALAVARALDARPPSRLAVEVLVAGAGESGAAGLEAHVRSRRRTVRPEQVVVVHLGSEGGGRSVRFLTRDGEHFGARLHPRLIALAQSLPGVERIQGRGHSGARAARGAGWPAIALEGEPRPLAAATLRLVAAIDADLARDAG